MINTSTIKQQQNLIDILTTQLEKEKARLKKLQSVETKICKTLETLVPILTEYPEYKNSIAEKLGLTLPPPTQLRVIEITDGEKTNNHQTIEKPQPENNPTPTITIKENITKVSSTFPEGNFDNETESNNSSKYNNTPTHPESNNNSKSNNTPTNPTSDTLVEKLEELAQLGVQHNLTIKINTQQLTGEVLAPHPNTEKLHPVVTFNLNHLEFSKGWLWQYNINIDNDNYHNICYTGSPTDFIQVLTRCAKYYFEKPVNNLITQLTKDFPLDWKHNKITNHWTKKLTEKESEQLTQNTDNPTGIIQLNTGFHQWNFHTKSQIITLKENNNDTTSDNNAETDSTSIDKSGDAPTPPTSDTVEISSTPNNPTVTWYNSSSGEVEVDSEKRYFRVISESVKDEPEIKFKKSTDSKKWIKPNNSITELFASAIALEFKAGKPEAAEAILEKLYAAATEVEGKFVGYASSNPGTIGTFYIPNEGGIEVGYNDGSWWFIRPEHQKVYCSGDVTAFAQVLKGLAAETVKNAEKTSTTTGTSNDFVQNSLKPLRDKNIVLWYDNNNGEITINQEKRYFQILWNSKLQKYQVGLKKSLSSQKWRKDKNPTAQKFVDAIMGEFKEYKPKTTNAKAEETTQNNTGKTSDCWYTPPEVIKPVIEVLETINLDPCSDDGKHIPATTHYTITEDGLNQQWQGKVFINPPYSSPSKWIEKLISEINHNRVTEAIALLPASTDTKWFEPLWSQPICFWKRRIKFLDTNYQPKSPARQSHCLVYWGENVDKFNEIFGEFGEVVLPKEDSQNIEIEPKEQTEKTLTFSQKIQQYLPQEWILEENFLNQVIIKEKNHQNNHVKLCNSTIGDIYIKHNQELLYTVNHQDIETVIDLIYSWFEQQKTVKKPSINPLQSNNNNNNQIESTGESQPTKTEEKTLTLTEKIKPYLPHTWELEENFFDQVIIREKANQNSHVKLTDCRNGEINIHHNQELLYTVNHQDIETVIDLIYSWFEQQKNEITPSINPQNSNNKNSRKIESAGEFEAKEKAEIKLTLFKKIIPYLPAKWELEEDLPNQIIIRDQTYQNSYVTLTHCLNGDIRITHKKELIYTVNHQDIETAIDLIYSWFEQQKTVTTTSINPQKSNNNSGKNNESVVTPESPKEDKNLPTLTQQIKPILSETWVLKTINNNEIIIYETKDKNSDFVQITKTSNSSTPFQLTHKGESYLSDNIADIKFALVSDNFTDINWEILSGKDKSNPKSTEFSQPKKEVDTDNFGVDIDDLDILIEIINNYDTDLTIQRKDKSTAYIKVWRKTVGNIFIKDDQTIEIAEREKQLLTESYSIDLDILIQDIYQKKVDKNKNNYLMGVGSLDAEFSNLDTLQNALHCLSNQLNLVTIRQGKTFKIYNGKGWLEHYLGSIVVNKSEITCDEQLSYELLNNHSTIINQLTNDIVKGETEIETDNYIITNETLKELLTKENWDNWNEQDFETAKNLLKELVDFSPAWNQLLETIRQKRKELIEQTIENNDDNNPDNNGGSKTSPSTPNNPNNNGGGIKTQVESNKENLETLVTAIKSYKTDLKMNKNCSKISFYKSHSQLGSVTINQGKLLAESKLVSHLTLFYGIDIKGLIKSIKYASKNPGHDVDTFAYISSNNNAFKPLGCIVGPTWEKGRERRGILQSVSGEIATIKWLDSGVPGDNGIGYVNINLLRYVSAQPLTKNDIGEQVQLSLNTVKTDNQNSYNSDEPTAESIASLNFSGLIGTQTTTPTNTPKLSNNQTPSKQRETGKTLTINNQNLTINGKAISFGQTLPQLLSGNKTVTRRLWKDNYAKRFINDWNANSSEFLYPALTKSYRVGGKRVGYVRLTHEPYQEKLVDMPSSELVAEGFPELSKQQFINRFFDGNEQQEVWVIRFEFIPNSPNKEKPELLSEQKKGKASLEEELINKVEKQLSMLDKFIFKRIKGIPKITLHISLKDEILGRIFTDTREGLVSDISLEKSLMERYGLDIKSLILDVLNGKQLQIENYRKKLKNIALAFLNDYNNPTWMDAIKAFIEKLEGFKVSHDEVYLTVSHYGTNVGNIHHNQDDELEVEQQLIGELAKYDFDLEAFLVAENIPYKLYYPKAVVVTQTTNETDTETLASKNKSVYNSCNGSKAESSQLNNKADNTSTNTENSPVNLLEQLAAVFEGFDTIRTKRSGDVLWFYRGDENLYPCLMQTRDGETFTLFPTVKLISNMKELFGIDVDQLCSDLETGKGVDINDYVDNSIWEQTIKDSHKNNETITWQDILNNAAINETTDSQTKNELSASTTTEELNIENSEHPEGLRWLKDTSIYNRSETYVVWNGSQRCGKICVCNKGKGKYKANIGKWYVSPNVFGPYYDTIEKAATACWQDFISKNATPTATEIEEDLIPF